MKTNYLRLFLFIVLTSMLISCGSGGGGVEEETSISAETQEYITPEVFTIDLTSQEPEITADGTSNTQITAVIQDEEDDPMEDVSVKFETIIGDLDDSAAPQNGVQKTVTVKTNSNGIATAILTSPTNQLGDAEITATAGNQETTTNVEIIAGPVNNIELKVLPDNLPADGSSTSSITAIVRDANGNLVVDGETIIFEITSADGTFSTTNSKQATASTKDGEATVTYTAGSDSESIEIIAKSKSYDDIISNDINLSVTTETQVYTIPEVSIIDLTSQDVEIIADGTSSTTITAVVLDDNADPMKDVSVKFETENDVDLDDPDVDISGVQKIIIIKTNNNGIASVDVTSPTNILGKATITATAGEVSQDINITVIPGPVAHITLEASPDNLPADGSSKSDIKVILTDENGNPVMDGETVIFKIKNGDDEDRYGRLSTTGSEATASIKDGEATVTYTASSEPANITIQAEAASDKTINAKINILVSAEAAAAISDVSISSDKVLLNAGDISQQATISVIVKDARGDLVNDGTRVIFTTTLGDIDSSSGIQNIIDVETTDGKAVAKLTSPSNISGTAIATITATVEGISNSIDISIVVGAVHTIALSADTQVLIANGFSSTIIRAQVTDQYGNNVADGERINFLIKEGGNGNLSSGFLIGYSDKSTYNITLNGETTVSYWTSDTVPPNGKIIIRASAANNTDVYKELELEIVDRVGSIVLRSDPVRVDADGESQSTITALVKDGKGDNAANGELITFTTDPYDDARFPFGNTAYTSEGEASVIYMASETPGPITIKAESTAKDITDNYVYGSFDIYQDAPIPDKITLSPSQTTVKSDNSDRSEIIATVLDENNSVLSGVKVSFSATGGELSVGEVDTDSEGKARSFFSSGTVDKSNRVITVKAEAQGITPKSDTIPIRVIGSTVTLDTDRKNITSDNTDSAILTITAKDAGGVEVYNTPVTISCDNKLRFYTSTNTNAIGYTCTCSAELNTDVNATDYTCCAELNTDVKGQVILIIRGKMAAESANITVTALKDTAVKSYIVTNLNDTFKILKTADSDSIPLTVGSSANITVQAGSTPATVVFSTSLGSFSNGKNIIKVYASEDASQENRFLAVATLQSYTAGVATVQAYKESQSEIFDTIKIAISQPPENAGQIMLQADQNVIAISIEEEDIINSLTLMATVRTTHLTGSQVVGNAPVIFSIINPTGGGEFISPVIVYTDSSGVAKTTFTSGALSSDAYGVEIKATVLEQNITDSINIVIGGTAGSVYIDYGTSIEMSDDETVYYLPMTVFVSDSNGNSVAGARVSLKVWPEKYSKGVWLFDPDLKECYAFVTGTFSNEDSNENLILDPDLNEDVNGDGELTPPSSAAGSVPAEVITGEDGTASFNLNYPKASAVWITNRITAHTKVHGTETKRNRVFSLPPEGEDAKECRLMNSPYNDLGVQAARIDVNADKAELIADSQSSTIITASVFDSGGGTVLNQEITFNTSAGILKEIGATSAQGGSTSITAITSGGVAQVKLFSSTKLGKATITVTDSTNNASGTTSVNLIPGPPDPQKLSVVPTPASMSADGVSISSILVTVVDAYDNPVADGEAVNMSVINGKLDRFVGYTSGGFVTFIYTAPTSLPDDESDTLTAYLANGEPGVPPGIISLTGPPIASIELSSDPETLPADGQSEATIFAKVTLEGGGTTPDGTKVKFSIVKGAKLQLTSQGVAALDKDANIPQEIIDNLNNAPDFIAKEYGSEEKFFHALETVIGMENAEQYESKIMEQTIKGGGSVVSTGLTANGVANTILTAGGKDSDFVTIRAEAGGRTSEIDVIYTQGNIDVSIIPDSILGTGEEEAVVNVFVTDIEGNSVNEGTVTFTISDTSMGGFKDYSDTSTNSFDELSKIISDGETQVKFIGGVRGGDAVITATWKDNKTSGSATINIQPPPAYLLVADNSPELASISVKGTGGRTTSQIVFEVKDSDGNSVADKYRIDFVIDSGPDGGEEILPLFAYTEGGKVSTILRSGFKSGPVSVKASYHHDTSISTTISQVAIKAGPPVGEEFGICAEYLNISGLRECGLDDKISCNISDVYGNAIPDNTAISFKTYNTGGYFAYDADDPDYDPDDPGKTITKAGVASKTLTSGGTYTKPLQGVLSVTAEANNGGRTTHITSIAVTAENPDIMYAGTNGGGVYKSTDGGKTWTNISRSSSSAGQNWIDPYINDIVIDPNNSNTIYAATGYLGRGNLYRSVDGGHNWNSNNSEEWGGIYNSNGAVLTVLCNKDYIWIGTEGYGTLYSENNGKNFSQSTNLGYGKTVYDIVSSDKNAVLYAATPSGVFRSDDSGKNWIELVNFLGDNVTTLEVITYNNKDILFAGTKDAGVWINPDATNSNSVWKQYNNGMGYGLSITTPVASPRNTGNGSIIDLKLTNPETTETETWTVKCIEKTEISNDNYDYKFSVTGTESGTLTATATLENEFIDQSSISFSIKDGAVDFEKGDYFTFKSVKDPGTDIRDLLVDENNKRLYAVTYFWGVSEPHSVGCVYTVELTNNFLPLTNTYKWTKAVDGLPQYQPPDDETLFAQHIMAYNNDDDPTKIYIGGEGINLYATNNESKLTNGTLSWQESKIGLTNLIMSRMPILFSGTCSMTVMPKPYKYTGTSVKNFCVPSSADYSNCTFYVYVQDDNGNPPIVGTDFTYTTYKINSKWELEADKSVPTIYSDTLTHLGTFKDPGNTDTDNPYVVSITMGRNKVGDIPRVVFEYTPKCDEDEAPGCSGGEREIMYEYVEDVGISY
ncbi:adhesin/invasin [Candidatus Magnetomoraceae bacterium gMMP-1]